MQDLKLLNKCNHRIINEKLKILGAYPNYYAILQKPAIGNNHIIEIVNQNNLYTKTNKLKYYVLNQNNYKYIYFNQNGNIEVDVREDIYPQNSYYATYYTNSDNCDRCILRSGLCNDINFNNIGKLEMVSNKDFLIQKFKKNLITAKGKNIFNADYGSELNNLIGKPKTALIILMIQNTIKDTVEFIKNQQVDYSDILNDNEKILKIDDFQILPTNDIRFLKFQFYLLSYSDSELITTSI